MPTYDYKCRTCDQSATLITAINRDLSIPICSGCKAEMVRDYGSPSVRFTGSGFYSTDNK